MNAIQIGNAVCAPNSLWPSDLKSSKPTQTVVTRSLLQPLNQPSR